MNDYDLPPSYQYYILNDSGSSFNASNYYDAKANIKIMINIGTEVLCPCQHADVAFLKALCLYRQGDVRGYQPFQYRSENV
jgi:hypothetical protein